MENVVGRNIVLKESCLLLLKCRKISYLYSGS
jgi:hypothetical protein